MHKNDWQAFDEYARVRRDTALRCADDIGDGDMLPDPDDDSVAWHPCYPEPLLIAQYFSHAVRAAVAQMDVMHEMSGQCWLRITPDLSGDLLTALVYAAGKLPDVAAFAFDPDDHEWLDGGATAMYYGSNGYLDWRDPFMIALDLAGSGDQAATRRERLWAVDAAKLMCGLKLTDDLSVRPWHDPLRATVQRAAADFVRLTLPFDLQGAGERDYINAIANSVVMAQQIAAVAS